MKLELLCRSCKEKFIIEEKESSRQDLIPKLGEYFEKRCKGCGTISEYHVNDVKAQIGGNYLGIIAGLAVMGFITILFWESGFITTLGIALGAGIIGATNGQALTSNHKAFNKYRIQSTPRSEWKRGS